jgi:hypothetical protein
MSGVVVIMALMMPGFPDHTACHGCGSACPDAVVELLDPATGVPDADWGEPFCPGCAPPGLALTA